MLVLVLVDPLVELVALDEPPIGPSPGLGVVDEPGKSSANFWAWSTIGRMNA